MHKLVKMLQLQAQMTLDGAFHSLGKHTVRCIMQQADTCAPNSGAYGLIKFMKTHTFDNLVISYGNFLYLPVQSYYFF